MAIASPSLIFSSRMFPKIGLAVGVVGFFWMALSWFTMTVFLGVDIARVVVGLVRKMNTSDDHIDQSRRLFMRRVMGGTVVAGSAATMIGGVQNALSTPDMKLVNIRLPKLTKSEKPIVMVQLSDIHVGNTIGKEYIEAIAMAVNQENPDLIVITGDLVDGSVKELADAVSPLGNMRSKYGTYFSTGNHEYYSGADAWVAHLNSIGIRVLRNEHVWIGPKKSGFYLAGIDDAKAGRWPGHGPDLKKALAGCKAEYPIVLLAHQPKQVHDAKKYNVDLQLSGHTHGGQIWPWHYLAKASQGGLLAGHSWHDKTQLYISRGTGYWGPPVRTFAPSEITKILLNS